MPGEYNTPVKPDTAPSLISGMAYHAIAHGSAEQNMLLIDIATRNIVCLTLADCVGGAARVMAEKRISSIVVTDAGGHPAGIVTERDMLQAMQSRCPPGTALSHVMSSPVITVPETMTCLDAYQVYLRDGIRHLVVVDDDQALLGVVSETDFRLHIHLSVLAGRRHVASVMSRSVFSIAPEASLLDALNLMQGHRDTCVVVVDAERPVGIVTERDIVRLYSGDPKRTDMPVSEIMSSPVLSITVDQSINEAAERMLAGKVRHLAVVDGAGRMAGLLSEHELIHAMTQGMIDDKLAAEGLFLHTLINTIPDLIWLKDADGIFLACNRRFERLYGASEKEIVGKTDYDFVDKEQADFFREYDRKAMAADQSSVNEEWLVFTADGYRGLFEVIKTPMRGNQGKLLGVLGVARDITERKSMEAVLAESEYRYRTLVENSPLCIHEIDLDGCLQSMNKAGLDMLRLDEEKKICGIPYLSSVSEQDNGRIRALLQAAINGTASHFEFVSAGDVRLYFKSCFIPIKDADGKVLKLMGLTENISERKRAEESLATREREFRTLAENSPDNIARYDCQARFLYANPTLERTLGQSSADLMGKTPMEIVPGGLFDDYQKAVLQVGVTGESTDYEQIIPIGEGQVQVHAIRLVAEMSADGRPVGVLGVGRDISEIKQAGESLRITASVFDNSQEAILITDADNRIMDVNPAFCRITGYRREEVLGKNPRLLGSGRQDKLFYDEMWQALKQEKTWRGEVWNRRKSGEIYAELLSISVICSDDGKVQHYVGVFSDISHFKAHEAELSRVAHYDALTGIPNRVLLADRMKHAIAQTSREQNRVAICYLDLDGFKAVNDTMGHEAGDQVLVEVAKRIGNTIRGGDTVARLGGDEFVALLLGLEQDDECMAIIERLLAAIAQPFTVKGQAHVLSASIGVSIYPLDDENPDTLLRHADQAMYVAKQSGKNRFCIYDPTLEQRARNRREFLESVRYGLAHGQFELYYQPKINLRTKQLVGTEALIRWRHPERGLLLPAEFLRAIENTELDIAIGDWVVAAALAQINCWHDGGLDLETSVNISAYHLESPGFAEKLQQQLAHYPGMTPGNFQIEVLETVALNDIAIVREVIETCREFGVGFALDDFGTGYCSLSYLGSLPVDVLKIDQSFVQDMLEDKGDKAIVQGIIALAHAFGRQTVAEGIELKEHYRALLDMGCEVGQGYCIARPMPADELLNWQAA